MRLAKRAALMLQENLSLFLKNAAFIEHFHKPGASLGI